RQFGLDPAKPLYDDAVRSREPRWGQYLQQVQTQAQQAQTLNAVEAWGSNKSHFQDLRGMMHDLLVTAAQQGTAARFCDRQGLVDLDKLYDAAVDAHPEIKRQIESQQQTLRAVEAWGRNRAHFATPRHEMGEVLKAAKDPRQFFDKSGKNVD